ncbi:MAG: MarR family winged helix-turn-helix transcriptional regulator [Gemmatimonas sp.]
MGTQPEQMFGFVIHEVARLLRRRFEQRLRSTGIGLTRAQCAALVHLAARGPCNQACLAQSLDIEPITLVRLLDRLQDAELVVRKPDPRDRRAHVVELTAKARPMLERIYDLARDVYGEAQAGLSKPDTERLLEQLNAIKGNLTESTAEPAEPSTRSTRRV